MGRYRLSPRVCMRSASLRVWPWVPGDSGCRARPVPTCMQAAGLPHVRGLPRGTRGRGEPALPRQARRTKVAKKSLLPLYVCRARRTKVAKKSLLPLYVCRRPRHPKILPQPFRPTRNLSSVLSGMSPPPTVYILPDRPSRRVTARTVPDDETCLQAAHSGARWTDAASSIQQYATLPPPDRAQKRRRMTEAPGGAADGAATVFRNRRTVCIGDGTAGTGRAVGISVI